MSEIYSRMQVVSRHLFKRYRQGTVKIIRKINTGVPVAIDRPWDGTVFETLVVELDATVTNVERRFINGTSITGSEDQINFPAPEDFEPSLDDQYLIDNQPRKLIDLKRKPGAGLAVAYSAIVGS
jgi:hypothetical protein